MKITQKLHQFTGEKALIIITGAQEADFHIASDGEVNKIDSFKLEKIHFSDDEGFFGRAGNGGKVASSGSVKEPLKEEYRQEFLKDLTTHLESIESNQEITDVYLLTPDYLYKMVEEAMSKKLQNKIKLTVKGNYYHEHPFELIEKIYPTK
ncbi:MAG: hypothetical protein COU71_00345 [Parcubacteria group bacterium CG10_big_fil_rev_8_21_14_0_10_38_31]|nr:MAG: hypothetical protein COU71_00345 [Parcubacteria group bacterium CG10_big_fil_rev_8_21_14_0_10_38_31]